MRSLFCGGAGSCSGTVTGKRNRSAIDQNGGRAGDRNEKDVAQSISGVPGVFHRNGSNHHIGSDLS